MPESQHLWTRAGGGLTSDALVNGGEEEDAATRFVFDDLSGMLYFDRDGAGGRDAVPFVLLAGVGMLQADDLWFY